VSRVRAARSVSVPHASVERGRRIPVPNESMARIVGGLLPRD
jgi:hypothetical protein